MNRKFIVSLSILIFSVGAIFFLWEQPWLLSALFALVAYVKHKLYPIKAELLWFSLVCIGGAIAEILLVGVGGVWSYSSTQLFDVPVWMPLFWGVVGTTIVVMYDGLAEERSRIGRRAD